MNGKKNLNEFDIKIISFIEDDDTVSKLDNVPKIMITRYSQLATEKANDVYRYIFIGDKMNIIQSPNEFVCPPNPPIASDRLR